MGMKGKGVGANRREITLLLVLAIVVVCLMTLTVANIYLDPKGSAEWAEKNKAVISQPFFSGL